MWHAYRSDDVTATSAAALFGVSPYETLFELYHRKAGTLTAEFETTERMRWGNRLQDAIAEGICEDNGWRILNRERFLYCRSRRFVNMGCSPDYIVLCPTRGVGVLEIKNVDRFIARAQWQEGDDDEAEAPVHIEMQLQFQLECTELPWGAIGGLIGGNESRVIIRDRDVEAGLEIGRRIDDLYRRIRDREPPPPDYLADYDAIRRLYRSADVGTVLDLNDSEESDPGTAARIAELVERKKVADAAFKAAEEDKKRAAAELLETVGDFETVILPGAQFKISATTIHCAERTEVKKAYSYRNLRVSKISSPKSK